MPEQVTSRIAALDGLRGVAILAVLAFHFYYSGAPPRTPISFYSYAPIDMFQYGRYGVELFFIISGFVIPLTLERCDTLREFAVKRFARLWPSMVLCSVMTYVVVQTSTGPALQPNLLRNFLPSWTFTDPQLWSTVTGEPFYWMDRAYWSLWVEVRFYAWAALLYFGFESFRIAFFGWAGLVLLLRGFNIGTPWLDSICIANYLPWFVMGVLLYEYGSSKIWQSWPAQVLSWKPLAQLGMASYSLYLLHQHIGLAAIGWLNGLGMLGPIIVLVGLIGLSQVIYRYWEQPWNRILINFRTAGHRHSPLTPHAPLATRQSD